MTVKNALEVKENIILILKRRGPSLPVHIAKETGLSILFAAAFLSELVADKRVRYTDMKVGSSPLYFLAEHASMLEKFSQYLNSREKDAFNLLKEKKFLNDSEQSPVIRVALRAIRDFAFSFNKNGQTFWRYYLVPESEFNLETKPEVKETVVPEKETEKPLIKLKIHIPKKEEKAGEKEIGKEKELEVMEKPEKAERPKKQKAKKVIKKKTPKHDENFFNKVKEWVLKNSMEIIDIQDFNKNELHLRIRKDGKDHLLVAYNKKRVNDSDLVKAHKKAKEMGLEYAILSFGELQRKMSDIIDAAKNLSHINKIE